MLFFSLESEYGVGWFLIWELMTNVASYLSLLSYISSFNTTSISNLERIASVRSTLSMKDN